MPLEQYIIISANKKTMHKKVAYAIKVNYSTYNFKQLITKIMKMAKNIYIMIRVHLTKMAKSGYNFLKFLYPFSNLAFNTCPSLSVKEWSGIFIEFEDNMEWHDFPSASMHEWMFRIMCDFLELLLSPYLSFFPFF